MLTMQGSKLRLIQSPMRLTFSPWRLKLGLMATLVIRFFYDLDLNKKSKDKTNISSYLALLPS